MRIKLIQFGKTHFSFVDEGFNVFASRLKHYCKFEHQTLELPSRLRQGDTSKIKSLEGELLFRHIQTNDLVILLDERGRGYSSSEFAAYLQKQFNHHASIVFVIGGAFGFEQSVYDRANAKVSLSSMTFSHQLIRLIFAEQLYRAFTLIKGEPYHHD